MRITQSTTTRVFVWLAAVTLPLQSLPLAACGCTGVEQRSAAVSVSEKSVSEVGGLARGPEVVPSCCSQPLAGEYPVANDTVSNDTAFHYGETGQSRHSCCSGESSTGAGCNCDSNRQGGCQCGDDCQCAKSSAPTEPVIPPAENNSLERVATDSTSVSSFAMAYQPSVSRQLLDLNARANVLTALDSCVALCRFTL